MAAAEQPEPRTARGVMRPGSLAEFDAPDSVWNRAAAQSAQGDPFCCRTEWCLSFHEAFHPRRPLHLRTDGSSVVAFAERLHLDVGPVLEPLESLWLFGCPLLGQHGIELLDAFFEERRALGTAPQMLLSGLLPGSPLLRLVARTFGSRCEVLHLEPALLVSASLEGGLDGWLARRSGHFRRRLRHAAQRAAARGVRFERCVPRGAGDAAAIHERLLAVERSSWKGIGRCGMAEPPACHFYGRMLHRLALAGAARVMFARHGDADIGFVFGGLAGAVYRGQQFSFAEDWRAASIGNLLQFEQLRWLGEESAVRYDMGPLMDYKRHWTETTTRIEARLLRPNARAQ
jgi:hypothetical protein